MTQKRILVLNGHPAETSISRSLAEAYEASAREAGHDVRMTHLSELSFDMDHGFGGYRGLKPLEPCLQRFQSDLEWADHFVMMTPMWWGGLPAKLKGLFDRTLLPGWAFDPRQMRRGMPKPLLTGRSAHVFVTSDTQDFFFRLLYGRALFRQIRGQILDFIGIKPTRITHFAPVGKPDGERVGRWLERVRSIGQRAR